MNRLLTITLIVTLLPCYGSTTYAQTVQSSSAQAASAQQSSSRAPEAYMDQLAQTWELTATQSIGNELDRVADDAVKDQLIIFDNHSVLILRDGKSGIGRWKYDPKNRILVIVDDESRLSTQFTVLELDDRHMVLRYEPVMEKRVDLTYERAKSE